MRDRAPLAALAAFDCANELDGDSLATPRTRPTPLTGLPPNGAFYLYAGAGAFGIDSQELSRRLLPEAGGAVAPGLDIDPRACGRVNRGARQRHSGVQAHRCVGRGARAAGSSVEERPCLRLAVVDGQELIQTADPEQCADRFR